MKYINDYVDNNENIMDKKNELKLTSISSPNIEENDNQYITNNELYINDNSQIDKNSSNKNDINKMDNKKSSNNFEQYKGIKVYTTTACEYDSMIP